MQVAAWINTLSFGEDQAYEEKIRTMHSLPFSESRNGCCKLCELSGEKQLDLYRQVNEDEPATCLTRRPLFSFASASTMADESDIMYGDTFEPSSHYVTSTTTLTNDWSDDFEDIIDQDHVELDMKIAGSRADCECSHSSDVNVERGYPCLDMITPASSGHHFAEIEGSCTARCEGPLDQAAHRVSIKNTFLSFDEQDDEDATAPAPSTSGTLCAASRSRSLERSLKDRCSKHTEANDWQVRKLNEVLSDPRSFFTREADRCDPATHKVCECGATMAAKSGTRRNTSLSLGKLTDETGTRTSPSPPASTSEIGYRLLSDASDDTQRDFDRKRKQDELASCSAGRSEFPQFLHHVASTTTMATGWPDVDKRQVVGRIDCECSHSTEVKVERGCPRRCSHSSCVDMIAPANTDETQFDGSALRDEPSSTCGGPSFRRSEKFAIHASGTTADDKPILRECRHGEVPKKLDLTIEYKNTADQPATTLMIRNIPNRCSQSDFIAELEELGFAETFDFLYLPVDKGTLANVGYAFVNFIDAASARRCMRVFQNHRFKKFCNVSSKLAAVSVAHIQGLDANLAHYEKATIMTAKLKKRRPWRRNADRR
eukprot:TRINITY_DN1087_c0_g1_i1.p1 TRINITY_DN1087_c0_g1~~TRINITY_DN1087_c0_g1_i1.p1  ORF type:complete len:619 (+),score=85.40 TRINITY_DN1087_c0_g1_i1:56-1858(+)